MNFNQIIKKEALIKIIEENNYQNPTPIQEQIMPLIIEGNDVLGQSQTGTGKTLAFAGPILEKIEEKPEIQSLILAPTRELAIQISNEIENYAKYMKIKTVCVYGSSSIETQIRELKNNPQIVIGTPGRVMDLLKRKVLKVNNIKFFVLDEADEMLSMGFKEDLEFIFTSLNKDKQVLLFSATMPKTILKLAEAYMKDNYKKVMIESLTKTATNIKQYYYMINDNIRLEAMSRVMDFYNPKKAIIFCRTKKNADDVLAKLLRKGYQAALIHGDITQAERIATLERFKSGKFNYLIATDVAARGIHVEDVELVINYNFPESNEAYVHRIGRTGRANKSGVAVTFVNNRESHLLSGLERHISAKIAEAKLPTLEEIMPKYVELSIKETDLLKDHELAAGHFKEYLSSLSKEDMESILANILELKLMAQIGSDFKEDLESAKGKRTKTSSKDTTRVFMTIGRLDNIEKGKFLTYIEKKCNIPEGVCSNMEILPKFTFMNIQNKYCDQVIANLNRTKYNNRVINIEKAKK